MLSLSIFYAGITATIFTTLGIIINAKDKYEDNFFCLANIANSISARYLAPTN